MLLPVTAEESLAPAAPATIPNPTAGMTTKVVKGSLWTLAGQVAPLGVSLITTPFVIRMLGAESYGVLILIGLIPSYVGFADFGMSIASTKFASEAYAEGDPAREARIVRTAALIALCSSVPLAVILFLFSTQIIGLFNVPDQLHREASLALKISAITFVVSFLINIFNTPQLTRLRMDLNTLVNSGFRILGLIATPFAIFYFGIVGAVAALLVASLLTLVGHLFFSNHLVHHLFESGIERGLVRQMLKFGGALVGASVAAVLLVNVEKGILAATVSSATLAHYSVAFTLASMMAIFSSSMAQSMMPAFSQLQSPDERLRLNALYSRGIRISLIWLIPLLVLLALFARPFFAIWAGNEFAEASTVPFYILLFGVGVNILAYLPYTAIMASGRTDLLAKLYWIELAVYIVVVWQLASRFGAIGAAAAWSARVMIDAFVQFVLASRFGGVRCSHLGLLKFAIAALVLAVPAAISIYLEQLNVTVVVAAIFCLFVYALLVFKTMLEVEELSWISHQINNRLERIRS